MEIYFIFSGILCFLILGHLGVHFYNKEKHKKLLEFLNGKDYLLVKNVSTDIDVSISKSIFNHINKANVIFFKDHIFLLVTSKIFRQAQPILQISRIGNNEKFANIWEEINYISKIKIEDKLRITGFSDRGSLKINYKIFLDFKNKNFDLESYLNESE
ncbi:hypothetical protein GCM10023210_43240 [Chryseobacterium ginsengisoli]|uniref:YokE-like PH domain-containing protein n=1 Tax=Chryseobacterium ginsengisoli TaxID=363853 RepID=A0ABP9MUL8_9FLAO